MSDLTITIKSTLPPEAEAAWNLIADAIFARVMAAIHEHDADLARWADDGGPA